MMQKSCSYSPHDGCTASWLQIILCYRIHTHIGIFVNIRHILITVCSKAVCGDLFYTQHDGLRSVHFTGAFHNTMRHKVRDSDVCHTIRNVHRSFVAASWWLLRDIWRVTAGFPRRHGAASTWTADTGSEQSRRVASMDRRRYGTGARAAAAWPWATDGRRSCGGIRTAAGICAVDDLNELSTFEHEQKVSVALQKTGIQLLREFYRLTKTSTKNQLLYPCHTSSHCQGHCYHYYPLSRPSGDSMLHFVAALSLSCFFSKQNIISETADDDDDDEIAYFSVHWKIKSLV